MLQSTSSTSSFRSGSISNKSSTKPQAKTDPNQQFLREVTSILNKVTPQTYDISLKKFDDLELNCAERLEGMVYLIYIKAVEAAIFCSLYAKLCKHFQKKQVTAPNESGQPVTLYFRQILLTLCQKEFENDHRQEIEYEKRKLAVDAITDEKVQKEAKEQLEEDLYKAKRKKFGNIMYVKQNKNLKKLISFYLVLLVNYSNYKC
jgi:translation initiation factor 4G